MNPTIALVLLVAAAAAATSEELREYYRTIPVVTKVDRRDHTGQFALKYLLGDGTEFSEQGSLKRTPDNKDNVLVKKGSYRYVSPEGVEVRVAYTADENGFHPISDSIPKPVEPIHK